MKVQFVFEQQRLFSLSSRQDTPRLNRGELVRFEEQIYQIADIEHVALPDGGVDRVRLETLVYLRRLEQVELASRREHQRSGPAGMPRRY